MRVWQFTAFAVLTALFVSDAASAWDSSTRNPTHPTHTYLTEYSVKELRGTYPDVGTYSKQLIDGANAEMHELSIKCTRYGVDFDKRRASRYGGTNVGCQHPELMWADAQDAYRHGQKELAYFAVGMLLHQIQDMGTPAHAHNIYHQGNLKECDYFEYGALWNWKPNYRLVDRQTPALKDPLGYSDPRLTMTSAGSGVWRTSPNMPRANRSRNPGRLPSPAIEHC